MKRTRSGQGNAVILSGLVIGLACAALLRPVSGRQARPPVLPPKPAAGIIYISGEVMVPDGRKLPGVTIKLYEVRTGAFSWIKDIQTTRAGFYSTTLGGAWLTKRVRLVPQLAPFAEGEHFSPREQAFDITQEKITGQNFTYNGPLADLTCGNTSSPPWLIRCAMVQTIPGGTAITVSVANLGRLAAGPFRVTLTGSFLARREIVVDFEGLRAALPGGAPPSGVVDVSKRVDLPGVTTASIQRVEIDVENAVIESNEGNNTVVGPFIGG